MRHRRRVELAATAVVGASALGFGALAAWALGFSAPGVWLEGWTPVARGPSAVVAASGAPQEPIRAGQGVAAAGGASLDSAVAVRDRVRHPVEAGRPGPPRLGSGGDGAFGMSWSEAAPAYAAPLVDPAAPASAHRGGLELEDAGAAAWSPTVDLVGRDADGPRLLVLWRVDPASGRAAPVAGGASDAEGVARFDRWPRPPGAVRLVAAPAGHLPDSPAASRRIELPALPPPPPVARATARDRGRAWRVEARLLPESTLEVLHPETGLVRVGPAGSSRRVTVDLSAPADGEPLALSQVTRSGERSAWRHLAPLGGPAGGRGEGSRDHDEMRGER